MNIAFDPKTWPLVAEVMSLEEALMIADCLRQAEIEAYIEAPATISPVVGYLNPMTRVYVAQADQESAIQALSEFYEDHAPEDDDFEEEAP